MSFLLCPLCGRNASLRHFHPSDFDVDVLVQDFRGLGKGKGFETTGRASILGKNNVVLAIADRILDLLKLFIDEQIVSVAEVRRRLGILEVETIVVREGDETQALREENESREQKIDDLITEIAEAMGENPEDFQDERDEHDEVVAKLRYFCMRLIDEYVAARENADEN